jgi:hypothetical protein
MKQIKEKQAKDGIMRRNKLLLEHIMVRFRNIILFVARENAKVATNKLI